MVSLWLGEKIMVTVSFIEWPDDDDNEEINLKLYCSNRIKI